MCFDLHFFLFITNLWHKRSSCHYFSTSSGACFEIDRTVRNCCTGSEYLCDYEMSFFMVFKAYTFCIFIIITPQKEKRRKEEEKEQKKCDFSVRLLHNKTEGMEYIVV